MNDKTNILDDGDVEIISRSVAHDGFLRVEQIRLRHRLFSGEWSEEFQRDIQLRNPAVGVLLFDPDRDSILLVRQFRVGMLGEDGNSWPYEIVAGMVASGEQLDDVARRESKEEANCVPSDLIPMCQYYSSPGGSNERITLYCGRIDSSNAGGIYGLEEEHEDIEVQLLSYSEAMQMLDSGQIDNAMTIVSLQWLQLHRQEVLEYWK